MYRSSMGHVKSKVCARCELEKPIECFARKFDAHQAYCKECQRNVSQAHYYLRKDYYLAKNAKARKRKSAFIEQLRNQPCTDCGGVFPPYVMEFDHVQEKRWSIGGMSARTWTQLRSELRRVEVVCANCHCIRTHRRKTSSRAEEPRGVYRSCRRRPMAESMRSERMK
jgi:hypothetical protein